MIIRIEEEPGVQPWDGEHEIFSDTLKEPAGDWVASAACIDYRDLTDVAAPIRLAARRAIDNRGLDAASKDGENQAVSNLTGIYYQGLDATDDVVKEVEWQAAVLSEAVPPVDRQAAIQAGRRFLDRTYGHTAVSVFVESLETAEGLRAT